MNISKILYAVSLAMILCLFSACEDTEEYPDGNFTIVGTWRYHVPALTGSKPNEGQVYNAEGRITFTSDMRFCFILDTDRGEVRGCGRYQYIEDTGIHLWYDGYLPIAEKACGLGYLSLVPPLEDPSAIGWGWNGDITGVSDIVRYDYLRVHTYPIEEYFRIETLPYEEVVMPYQPDGEAKSYYVSHDGQRMFALPEPLYE